jgi:hypothetical protein
MVIPREPAQRAAIQDSMARASMGDPAALKTAFLSGQVAAVRAKVSGTIIRLAHEQT